MASKKLRKCVECGVEGMTFSRTAKCHECTVKSKNDKFLTEQKDFLLSIGYSSPEYTNDNESGKRVYTVITPCCSTEQSMIFSNIKSLYKKNGVPSCPKCGGKARMAKAHAGYMEIYGREYDETLFNEYATKVRRVSDSTFIKNKNYFDPDGTKFRGVAGIEGAYQLDHKMSIRSCFMHSIPIELAGSLLNLTLIPASDNLSKCFKSSLDLREWVGVDLSEYDPEYLINHSLGTVVSLPPPLDILAEHVQRFVDESKLGRQAHFERLVKSTDERITQNLIDCGYTNVECLGKRLPDNSRYPDRVFKVTYEGRTVEVFYQWLEILIKNKLFVWPEGTTYKQFIKEICIEKFKKTVISDEERKRRSDFQKNRKLSESAKKKVSEAKKGYTRWYHPDFPSYKQAKVSPGEGWTNERPLDFPKMK